MIATVSSNNGKGPYHVIMNVTVEQALQWLEGNTHNRPVNEAHVKRLARDIQAGRWRLTHQGIAFDTDGLLIDGQHRLWAIIEAGTSITTRVFFNEPPENRHVLDSGQRRSNLDILNLTGQVGEVTSRHLATLRAMLAGCSSHTVRVTPGEEAEQYRRHRGAVEFAVQHLNTAGVQGVAKSDVRAAIARAWYSTEHGKLVHACDVLKSGMPAGNGDAPLCMLRNFLISTGGSGKGESVRRMRYSKVQWALSAFLQGKTLQRLCSATTELFPLPEEMAKTTAA